jgi:CRISPR/Cas system CSM-associated protein Csm3 (group 7 of RAMP superfamily)
MARQTDYLIVVTGELVAETALHVGGSEEALKTDLPLAVDGRGRFYIPGTSLAGAIRAWLDRAFAAEHDDRKEIGWGPTHGFWGHGPPRNKTEEEKNEEPAQSREERAKRKVRDGIASRMVVHDAVAAGKVTDEIRDHVGIDRHRGAAASGIKYDRQIVPKGTRFDFRMDIDLANYETAAPDQQGLTAFKRSLEDDRKKAAAMVVGLSKGLIRFGAAKTRGLGKLAIEKVAARSFATDRPKGILDLVRSRAGKGDGQANAGGINLDEFLKQGETKIILPPLLRITIDWKPVGPVMVKSSADGLGVDMLPLVSGVGDRNKRGEAQLAQVLPGSSIKGALRAHAERIGLTVGLPEKPGGAAAPKECPPIFLDQIARVDVVKTLFGIPGQKQQKNRNKDEHEGVDTKGRGLGAVFIDDCFARERRITAEKWRELTSAAKTNDGDMGLVLRALKDMGWEGDDPAAHVAIDRWTGGAAPNLLFSGLEPRKVDWEPIVIEVALDRLTAGAGESRDGKRNPEEQRAADLRADAAVALLILTLRDLASGRVPLGFGGNRGYGAIEVTKIAFEIEGDQASEAVKKLRGEVLAPADATSSAPAWTTALAAGGRLDALNERWKESLPPPAPAPALEGRT